MSVHTKKSIEFSCNLVKGRIAETLFEQMLRGAGGFTILAFGYENVLPELTHKRENMVDNETMDIIKRSPDFVVINNDNHEVYLIEVKYRTCMKKDDNMKIANRMAESWKPSYLFIMTPHGFYFDKALTIVNNGGDIAPLSNSSVLPISEQLQSDYAGLLNEYITEDIHRYVKS